MVAENYRESLNSHPSATPTIHFNDDTSLFIFRLHEFSIHFVSLMVSLPVIQRQIIYFLDTDYIQAKINLVLKLSHDCNDQQNGTLAHTQKS